MSYANNKGADQTARISAFVIRCFDSIIPLVSIHKISSLSELVFVAESYLVGNPEDRFSRDVAHIVPERLQPLV